MTNPFIEALPPMISKENFDEVFSRSIVLNPSDTLENKLIAVRLIKTGFVKTFSDHYYFYSHCITKMISSYVVRTPRYLIDSINQERSIDGHLLLQSHIEELRISQCINVSYLSGIAGSGKSLLLNFIVSRYPKSIPHPSLGIIQVPILKIQTPPRASRKDICKSILEELDDCLGSDYRGSVNRMNENDLQRYVRTVLLCHYVGMIIFDEFQDLKVAKTSGVSDQTLAFIKKITNNLGISIVFAGSVEIEEILFGNFQLASRSQGVRWDRMAKESSEFSRFVNALFKHNFLECEIDNNLAAVFYDLSQGVPRILVNLYIESLTVALHFNASALSQKHILIAWQTFFKGVEEPIDGIRSFNSFILDRYPDLKKIKKFKLEEAQPADKIAPEKKKVVATDKSDKIEPASSAPVQMLGIDKYLDGSLIEFGKRCTSSSEMHNLLVEQGIIKQVSEFLEF